MKPADLLALLTDFYREKLAQRQRHEAAARHVGRYEVNNTYQYIIAREDVQLTWLRAAIEELGGVASEPVPAPDLPPVTGDDSLQALLRADRDLAQELVDGWRERIEPITHARHKGMLRVILGEALEQKRFFEQALAGRSDLLGRRSDGAGTAGTVLPTRWIE